MSAGKTPRDLATPAPQERPGAGETPGRGGKAGHETGEGPLTPSGAIVTPLRPTPLTPGAGGEGRTLRPGRLPEKQGERLELLGRGGFGEVWRVRYIGRDEAWKYLPRRPGSDFQAFREAVNARSVDHENVVRIHDIDDDENHFIIRMDLVRGRDLERVVAEDGVLSPSRACRYAIQVAGALEAAHRTGILHLDLKPSNLILEEGTEKVKITDFGISATLSKGVFQVEAGMPQGTPYFLAPEQLSAERVQLTPGPGVDIWALGITFYYLLARAYPFPFREKGPDCILQEEPRPLPEILPYVSDDLWAVVERMLRRDRRERFAAMADVRDALIEHVDEITCPACGKSHPVEHVQGLCPTVQCPDGQRVGWLKEKRTTLREGHDHFARCEYAEAAKGYRDVLEMERREGQVEDFSAWARRLITIAERQGKDLQKQQAKVEALLDSGDYLQTIKEIDRVRRRFSGDERLRGLARDVVDRIIARYDGVGPQTRQLVKQARFLDAKSLLTEIEGYLGYERVGKVLREWEAQQARAPAALRDLYHYVEDREREFAKRSRNLERALRQLDLKRAVDILTLIDATFPSPRNAEKIRLYSDLADSLAYVRGCEAARLCEELEAGAHEGERLELERARAECDRLIESFEDREVPALEAVRAKRVEIEASIERLCARKERLERDLGKAEQERRFPEQLEALENLQAMAQRTDLLSAEDSGRYEEKRRKVAEVLDMAAKKYEEGNGFFDYRRYQAAILAFEASENLASGIYPDIASKVRQCREQMERENQLRGEIAEAYSRIMGEGVVLDDFKSYLQVRQQLEGLQAPEVREEVEQKTPRVIARLFNVQSSAMASVPEGEYRLELLAETVDVLSVVSQESLLFDFFQKGSELGQSLADLVGRVFAPLENRKVRADQIESRISILRGIIGQLGRLSQIVQQFERTEYRAHPAERASAVLLACRTPCLDLAEAEAHLGVLLALHEDLLELSDDATIRRQVQRGVSLLRRTQRWRAFGAWARRVQRYAPWVVVPVATALVVWGVLAVLYRASGEKEWSGLRSAVIERALLPPGRREKNTGGEGEKNGDQGERKTFVHFLKPLLDSPGSAPGDAKSLEELAVWWGSHKSRWTWLMAATKGGAGAPGDLDVDLKETIADRLKEERTVARESVLDLVKKRLEKFAEEAHKIDLALEPDRYLEEAREGLEAAEKVCERVGLGDFGKEIGAVSGGADGKFKELEAVVSRLQRLAKVAREAQKLATRTEEVYWSKGVPEDFVDDLKVDLDALLKDIQRLPEGDKAKLHFVSSVQREPANKIAQRIQEIYRERFPGAESRNTETDSQPRAPVRDGSP